MEGQTDTGDNKQSEEHVTGGERQGWGTAFTPPVVQVRTRCGNSSHVWLSTSLFLSTPRAYRGGTMEEGGERGKAKRLPHHGVQEPQAG